MEIERKYLVTNPPEAYTDYPFRQIEQGYLCTDPVVRIRRDNDSYYLTYKSKGLLSRQEYNLPLTIESYGHLLKKSRRHCPYQAPVPDSLWFLYHRTGHF